MSMLPGNGPSSTDLTAHPVADAARARLDAAAGAAGDALRSANRAARDSVQGLADGASQLAHEGARAVQARATQWRDTGTDYIRERPLQSILLAVGAGAVLAVLLRTLTAGTRPR